MLIPVGWWVCITLLVPARLPVPAGPDAGAAPRPSADPAEVGAKLDAYFAAVSTTLSLRPREALRRIPNPERRLLAVAHYVQRQAQVDTLWTWTEAEARAHQRSAGYRRAAAQLRAVRRRFALLNPGYTLVTDTNARPLGIQVRYWNREPSVLAAARELRDSAGAWLAVETYPVIPDSSALDRFVVRLETYSPTRLPTVAVPGLSLHGQLRAYDFAVLRRGRVVAGPQSATLDSVWERGGWAERLREAVTTGGQDFAGPLGAPREPWHYEYRPEEQ